MNPMTPLEAAIYHSEEASTYKGRNDSVSISRADLLLLISAAKEA